MMTQLFFLENYGFDIGLAKEGIGNWYSLLS
jgi:hypothetical protein